MNKLRTDRRQGLRRAWRSSCFGSLSRTEIQCEIWFVYVARLTTTGPSDTIQVVQGSPDNMTHIEAKSINIWLRYDPKHLVSTQTWGDIPFWVISQPNVDGFCSNMDNLKATIDAVCIVSVSRVYRRTTSWGGWFGSCSRAQRYRFAAGSPTHLFCIVPKLANECYWTANRGRAQRCFHGTAGYEKKE